MYSIFPQYNTGKIDNPDSTRGIDSYSQADNSSKYGKSPIFDFEKGEFQQVKDVDGNMRVYMGKEIETLKNWVEKALRTERYQFPIYSFNYGVTLEELIGKNLPYQILVERVKYEIKSALLINPRITDVQNFQFSREGSYLGVRFEVTSFGKEKFGMEVMI